MQDDNQNNWNNPGAADDAAAQNNDNQMPTDAPAPDFGAQPAMDAAAPQMVVGGDGPSDTPAPDAGLTDQAPAETPAPAPVDGGINVAPAATPSDVPTVSLEALGGLKQKAIGDLTPLLEHLDQTPEDRFRTAMMMVQATDNKDLLPTAYEAANAIVDEKLKAQALLDVINEVNYFTQHDQHPGTQV